MKKLLLVLMVVGLLPVFGRTVAWYRLDGFAPGEKTTADTVIENIADPGHLQGKCYSCTTASTTYGTDPSLMPYGSVGFNGAFGVLDPVTGEWSARTNTMHFGLETCTSGQSTGNGSTVKVATDESLALSTITVEVIFRAVPTLPTSWNSGPIVMMNGMGISNEGWNLCFGWNGKLAVRWYDKNNSSPNMTSPNVVTPGEWHHAAFTMDTNGTARLYYDYGQLAYRTGTSLKPWANKDILTIASHPSRAGRTFPGEVLDVRISDTALAPEQFLRVGPKPRRTTPETVLYVPFSGCLDPVFHSFVNLNAATNRECRVNYFADATADAPVFDLTDKPYAANRFGIDDAPLVENAGSYHIATNAAGRVTGLKIRGNQADVAGGEFTFECNFKTQGQNGPGEAKPGIDYSWTLYRSDQLQFCIQTNGQLLARIFNADGGWNDIKTTERVDDGAWHHVAVVWNYTPMQRLYLDGVQISRTWVTAKTGTSNIHLFMHNNENDRRSFSGWVDEVRLTRKALKQTEFMMPYAVSTETYRTLMHAAFDGDYSVGPYPMLTTTGYGVARQDGSGNLTKPTFSTYCRGDIVWDGENGTDIRENKGSVFLDGSQVRLPNVATLKNNGPYTVEWFMKLSWAESGVGLLRLNRTAATFEKSNPAGEWMLYGNGTALQIQAYIEKGQRYMSFPKGLPTKVTDNRWHHYALTVSEVEVVTETDDEPQTTTNTCFELWRDYVSYGIITNQDGRLTVDSIAEDFSMSFSANNNLTGYYDELRVTEGVLPPEKFMRVVKRGMMLIVR